MNEDSEPSSGIAAPAMIEDVFLTDVFLIKGRLENKTKRLSNTLEDHRRHFLSVRDATLVSLRNHEVIRTPTVMVNVEELILAHELVSMSGDETQRRLASGEGSRNRIRAFYNGSLQFEIAGLVSPGAYESQPITQRRYFVMRSPVVRGLDLDHDELRVLRNLDYAILKKDRMAYVYDFG